MRITCKKIFITFSVLTVLACGATGCKASKKKVVQSSYYQELKDKYDKLKAENKELQAEADENSKNTEETQRENKYLAKIARDHLVKLEVGYADNMEGSEFVEDDNAFILATGLAVRAAKIDKYSVDQLDDIYDQVYKYILYDENNAIYEMTIYEGDYVVMSDLPDDVFYCYNASALGEAFLHYKSGYPNSTLLHRFADSPIVVDEKGNCFENNVISKAINTITQMDRTKSSKKKAEAYWKKHNKKKNGTYEPSSVTYTFYHHGNTMKMTLYDVYIRLENMDGKATWYKVSKKDVAKVKSIFSLSNSAETVLAKSNVSEATDSSAASTSKDTSTDTSAKTDSAGTTASSDSTTATATTEEKHHLFDD